MEQVSIREHFEALLNAHREHVDERFDRLEARLITWPQILGAAAAVSTVVGTVVGIVVAVL